MEQMQCIVCGSRFVSNTTLKEQIRFHTFKSIVDARGNINADRIEMIVEMNLFYARFSLLIKNPANFF